MARRFGAPGRRAAKPVGRGAQLEHVFGGCAAGPGGTGASAYRGSQAMHRHLVRLYVPGKPIRSLRLPEARQRGRRSRRSAGRVRRERSEVSRASGWRTRLQAPVLHAELGNAEQGAALGVAQLARFAVRSTSPEAHHWRRAGESLGLGVPVSNRFSPSSGREGKPAVFRGSTAHPSSEVLTVASGCDTGKVKSRIWRYAEVPNW